MPDWLSGLLAEVMRFGRTPEISSRKKWDQRWRGEQTVMYKERRHMKRLHWITVGVLVLCWLALALTIVRTVSALGF
jgi:hypothetical protein